MNKPTCAQDIGGWFEGGSLSWVAEVAPKCQLVIEIGVWLGRSTYQWCEHCPGKVIAIDHFLGSESHGERNTTHKRAVADRDGLIAEAKHNLSRWIDNGKLELLEMSSAQAALQLDGCVMADLVYIDSDHSYECVSEEITRWLPLVKPGGILAGHDRTWQGVKRAIDELLPDWENGGGCTWQYQHPK